MSINIKKPLRQNSIANTDDVFKIKQALLQTGHYEIPSYGLTPYPDRELFSAIKGFQKDEGLTVDGIVNPDGETLHALRRNLNRDLPSNSPTFWCTHCGGPHGGSKGGLCPWCDMKK